MNGYHPKPSPWKRILYVFFVVLIAGVSGLIGAAAGGFAVYQAVSQNQSGAIAALPAPPEATEQPTVIQHLELSNTEVNTAITRAVEKVGPAVVTVVGVIPPQQTFFGITPENEISGSGVIISEEGYIVTNNHVIADISQVSVILADGSELGASVVSSDPYADLAVLKVDGKVPAVAVLGNSDGLKPGETVIAIGSPLGDFKNSVTVGVVSATGRMIDTGQGYQMEDLIQTDAAINQGNSGGPLVNLAGEVVGINTLIIRGSGYGSAVAEGLGFAIPSNTVKIVAEQIIQNGYFARPYLGVRYEIINPYIASRYNLPVEWGAYITQVQPGSPAAKGGLRDGDIIVRIGEDRISEQTSFVNALFHYQPGQTVTVEVLRGEQKLEIQVTLGEMAKK